MVSAASRPHSSQSRSGVETVTANSAAPANPRLRLTTPRLTRADAPSPLPADPDATVGLLLSRDRQGGFIAGRGFRKRSLRMPANPTDDGLSRRFIPIEVDADTTIRRRGFGMFHTILPYTL